MPDPSLSPLPPEWVEAIRDAIGFDHREWLPRLERALAPLLAERDAAADRRLRELMEVDLQAYDAAMASMRCAHARNDADAAEIKARGLERDQARADARRLRETLEWYGDEANYGPDGDPGEQVGAGTDPETGVFEAEWEHDMGDRARAALSACPVPEPRCEDCNDTGWYEVVRTWIDGSRVVRKACACGAPVSVPEQEEERAQCICHRGPQRGWRCPVHPPAAAASSSSEEGERAHEIDRELKVWPIYFDDILSGATTWEIRRNDAQGFGAGCWIRFREWDPDREKYTGRTVDRFVTYIAALDRLPGMDGLVGMTLAPWRSLRERLTSDEAVEAWQSASPISMSTEGVRRCLAAVADCVGNRTEGGRHG